MLTNIQAIFLPKELPSDNLEKRSLLLMLNVTLVTTLFALIYLSSTVIFKMENTFWVMVLSSILFFSNAVFIRFGVHRKIVANIYVSEVLVCSFGVIYFTGGLYSFDIPWLILAPVCAVLLDTGKHKLVWILGAAAIVLFFGSYELLGVSFPMELSESYKPLMFIISGSGLFVILFIIISILERTSLNTLNKLIDSNKQLEVAKKKSDKLNEIKDTFFSIISHDLRGPVGIFLGLSKVMQLYTKKGDSRKLAEIADEMEITAGRISNLLDNLLNWAVQQRENVTINPEMLNLKGIVEENFALFEHTAQAKQITLTTAIENHIELFADRNSTHVILRNLINNSLKFTKERGAVTVSSKKEDDNWVDIVVRDTGIGMPDDKLNSLFDLEVKSTYGTSGEKGIGLGLQLVKEFVTLNNGRMEVRSEVGIGTEFKIKLPAADHVKKREMIEQ